MKVTTFFILLSCVLQRIYGSSSKKKGGKLKNLVKTCSIIFFANEISNGRNRQEADSNALACKYAVPDQNVAVIVNFAVCAKDPDFEKYLNDNSEKCSKIKKVYDKAKDFAKCAWKIPTIIFNGVLAKFRGEQLSPETNVEMMKSYLNPVLSPEVGLHFDSEKIASMILQKIGKKKVKNDFHFFRFTHLLELTKEVFPGEMPEKFGAAATMTLDELYHGDADLKHVKAVLELVKVKNPKNEKFAALEAFYAQHKDVDTDQAKRLFELSKLMVEDEAIAMSFAMHSDYKDVDVNNAKSLLKLAKLRMMEHYGGKDLSPKQSHDVLRGAVYATLTTHKDVKAKHAKSLFKLKKLQHPNNIPLAAKEALDPKYQNINVDKVYKKYKALKKSGSQKLSEKEIMEKAFKVTYPEILKDDF